MYYKILELSICLYIRGIYLHNILETYYYVKYGQFLMINFSLNVKI